MAQVIAAAPPVVTLGELEPEMELVPATVRPRIVEMVEEAVYTPLPRDFASDLGNTLRVPVAHVQEEEPVHASALFPEPGEESQPDLDVPAFMRRSQI